MSSSMEQQKATLDEMMKKAEAFMESEQIQKQLAVAAEKNEEEEECCVDDDHNKLQYVAVGGFLQNETTRPLWLVDTDYHIYAGSLVPRFPFPSSVPVGSAGATFAVAGTDVEVAVVYSGVNKDGVVCQFIFGFLADSNDAAKIYVACGLMGVLKIDWADIKNKIDSGASYGVSEDSGVCISAQINPGCTAGNYYVSAYYYYATDY